MISIVMPTYNRENTIKKVINSVLKQTYKDFELIIVDDGSKDKTDEIVKGINDKRIRYYKLKTNKGACYARNYGISKAKSDIIAFHDSDDLMHKDRIEKQYNYLMNNDCDLCFCRYNFIKDDVKYIRPLDSEINKLKNMDLFNYTIKYGNIVSTQCIMGKKECFKDIIFDESLPRLQDYDLVLRLSKVFKWALVDDVLVDVIVQGDSISKNPTKLKTAIDLMTKDNKYDLSINELKNNNYRLNYIYANNVWKHNPKEAKSYFKKCLKNKFDLKTMIKYIICIFK